MYSTTPTTPNHSAFRVAEKKYKLYNKTTTDYTDVVDFQTLERNTPANRARVIEIEPSSSSCVWKEEVEALYGVCLQPGAKVYTLKDCEGLYFINNPFTHEQQLYWIEQCLRNYPEPPNKTSLTATPNELYTHNLFDNALLEKKDNSGGVYQAALEKLRWVTLGYHYDWKERIYREHDVSVFPPKLGELATKLAEASGHGPFFSSEAAIVNFYASKSTLGGHLDDSEFDNVAPIVSISFGNTSIFLLGTQSFDDPPTAMFVRSGDIVFMGGKSRMCYHGVPRIIAGTCPDFTEGDPDIIEYIQNHRININIRQVLERGKAFPQPPTNLPTTTATTEVATTTQAIASSSNNTIKTTS